MLNIRDKARLASNTMPAKIGVLAKAVSDIQQGAINGTVISTQSLRDDAALLRDLAVILESSASTITYHNNSETDKLASLLP